MSELETASRSTARVAEVGLFDREDALRALHRHYEEVHAHGGLGIVAVSGDAGLGKTRLLLEFEARLRTGQDVPRVAYGRALASNSVGNGFQPLREALADLLVEEEKRGRDRLRRLGSLIKTTAPDWLDALPVVGGVLHAAAITAQQAAAADSVPDSMNAQFLALLEQVAGDRPVVLLLDDLHWADASTVDLLFFLSQRLRKPVLLVLAYRALDLRGREDHHPLRQTLWRMERYCPVRPAELLALSDMGAEPTKRALRFLCQRIGLVRATETGDGYTFYHGVIRDYVRQRHEVDDPLDYREINRSRADYLAQRTRPVPTRRR